MFTHLTTQAALIVELGAGSEEAWERFAGRYGELIRWFARRRGLGWADCDDVLQETLLALSRAMPGFQCDPARGKFRSYLKTVVERIIRHKFLQDRPLRPLP